ncbi:NERD domain-containing protein [Nocardioides allogilvus]|uniref:NERD domain-containing protein n=1 Tax=Nocardioides allogilvus TaxID=2072017 RepID=UPI000D316E92|nr:NERD domain-containing protein [Nocardioides allogilvus]
MAVLHTPRPSNRGELAFVSRVEELLGDDTHVWTELNSHTLGSGDECDLLLAAPNLGAFAIEIKAIILDQIEEMGPKTCKIRYPSGVQTKHPLEQARSGMNSLRNYLQKHAQGSNHRHPYPFMKHVVALPKITFAQFEEAFAASSQLIELAESWFLFADDLESTESLRRQLQSIYGERALPDAQQIDFLVSHLSIDEAVTRKPQPSSADAERAKVAIQRVVRASAPGQKAPAVVEQTPRDRAYLGPTDPRVVIFEGAPGTGKTIELMRLALEHARNGRRVLFTCFNLVLASFLEGMLAHEDVGDELASHIDIIPVGRLTTLAGDDATVMADLYDTVCVDESQDLSEWAFDNIQLVAKDDARWFLADGPGQELYSEGTPAPLLLKARERAGQVGSLVKLTTSRRAASAALQIARSVRDIAPSTERIAPWYSTRAIQRPSSQGTLDLEIEAVPDPTELIDVRFWKYPPGKDQCFQDVLTELLDRLDRERRPRDLAILVARTKNDAVNLGTVRKALDLMGVPYLDQTLEANKSIVLPEGHVRLVSYSSARGIEASRVLLLDLGYAFWEPKTKAEGDVSRAMLYVALTRGRLGTTVLCAPVEQERAYVDFLVSSVGEYQRLMQAVL